MARRSRYRHDSYDDYDDYYEDGYSRRSKRRRKRRPYLDEVLARRLGRVCRWNGTIISLAFITIVFLVMWRYAWSRVRDRVLETDAYQFAVERVELIPPPPSWVRTDIRGETLRDMNLDDPSIMNPDLTEQLANAFAMHPLIAEVIRVEKGYPGRVRVELIYRQPACMVECWIEENGESIPALRPVDQNGIVLPTEHFRPEEAVKFPRLAGVNTDPVLSVGLRWGDIRVSEGAQIASALGEQWYALDLHRITPGTKDLRTRRYNYALTTRSGTTIHLGTLHEPPPGYAGLNDKVAWLVAYYAEHGTLDGGEGPQEIDLRALLLEVGGGSPQAPPSEAE